MNFIVLATNLERERRRGGDHERRLSDTDGPRARATWQQSRAPARPTSGHASQLVSADGPGRRSPSTAGQTRLQATSPSAAATREPAASRSTRPRGQGRGSIPLSGLSLLRDDSFMILLRKSMEGAFRKPTIFSDTSKGDSTGKKNHSMK